MPRSGESIPTQSVGTRTNATSKLCVGSVMRSVFFVPGVFRLNLLKMVSLNEASPGPSSEGQLMSELWFPGRDRRDFLKVARCRAELADARRAAPGPPGGERTAAKAGAVDHPALAGRRPQPARDVRSAPRHARSPAARRPSPPPSRASSSPRASSSLAEQMGSVALVRSMVSKEGDHERGTYTDEDRLPARPDGRCTRRSARSAATSCRSAAPRFPGTSRSCPASGRAAAASSATSSTPSRPTTPPSKRARRDAASVPAARDAERAGRPGRRRSAPSPAAGSSRVEATLHRDDRRRRPAR